MHPCSSAPGRRFARAAALLGATTVLAGCSADADRNVSTFALPAETVAPIRMNTCVPGTFIGTMTITCPQAAR